MRYILDIEANDLLQNALDYTSMPFKLKPSFKVHCVVLRHVDTGAVKSLYGRDLTKENLKHYLRKCTELIGHNIVSYDLPVLSLYGLVDYTVNYPGSSSIGTLFDNPIKITDTLIWSKLLNADRLGGHSLDAWGKRLGNHKTAFDKWDEFTQEMLDYCIQDTAVNKDIFLALLKEQEEHDWSKPYSMEIKLIDLTLRQEVFGFHFDKELAQKNLAELESFMSDIAKEVDPLLPEKAMPKSEYSDYIPPKIRFKKDGSISAAFIKWLAKVDATYDEFNEQILFRGKSFPVDYQEPLLTHTKATIEDIDTVKGYLLSLGWVPSEVKERDLTKRQDKRPKTREEIVEAIQRYVKQTETSVFKDIRLEMLESSMQTLERDLRARIDGTKPIWVPSAPKLTVGVEKDICPNLIKLGEKAAFVKKVVEYYTYRHRKNSIAGGALDEDGEPNTGFLSCVREDGRIPTPADTLGANTGRYRHKVVCNIPRVTSLYGEPMRNLFGCGSGLYQLGYDFASLEARVMGHYVLPYTDGEALATALVAEKPNDIHSINAKKLGIDRSAAKSFSYAAIYGAQPKKLSKMLGISEREGKKLFNDYWDAVPALKELKEKLERRWELTGKTHIPGMDGRLLNTRSKHSLVNVLFQSGGAISAKWSAVRLAQYLEEKDLLGDPFKHTKNDSKVWFMIHMHDEQQLAVHPSLMKIKTFDTEEEAKAFAKATSGSSAVGHGSKGYYVGLMTEPVRAIEYGIKSACKELALKVDLGFEWIPGKTWGQCH